MINSHQVHHGRLKIMNVYRILGHVVSDFIRLAVGHTRLHTTTSHPIGETAWVVIATICRIPHLSLAVRRSPEFASPDDQGLIEQTTLFQIFDQCCLRLINILALLGKRSDQATMLIPSPVIELNKTNTTFGQSPGQEAVGSKLARGLTLGTVSIKDVLGLVRNIGSTGYRQLHPKRHFILSDSCRDFRIPEGVQLKLVKCFNPVDHATPRLDRFTRLAVEIENRSFTTPKLNPLVNTGQKATAPKFRIHRLAAWPARAIGDQHAESWQVIVG